MTPQLKMLSLACLGAGLLALTSAESAQALTLTFDDLPNTPVSVDSTVLSSYGGLDWQRANYVTAASAVTNYGSSGYLVAAVSGSNVAFNAFRPDGNVPIVVTKTGGGAFNFLGSHITSIWRENQTITVEGFLGGSSKYLQTLSVGTTAPSLFSFNYANIDQLRLSSSGGTPNLAYSFSGNQFALDNFNYTEVPTPALLPGLMALGLVDCGLDKPAINVG